MINPKKSQPAVKKTLKNADQDSPTRQAQK